MADGIQYCNDNQVLPKHMRAERMDMFANGGIVPPSRTHVIARDQPIRVQRQVADPEASVLDMEDVGVITEVGSGVPPPEPQFAERPEGYADDNLLQKAAGMDVENNIGVVAPQNTTTILNGMQKDPTPLPGPPAVQRRKRVDRVMGPPQDGVLVPTPPPERTTPRAAAATEKPKVRVRLSNKGMGRLTVSVQHAAVSDSLVVLAYPKDADNIAEPPVADAENPVTVDIGENSYKCMFGGWTVEMEQLFLVVLVRLTD